MSEKSTSYCSCCGKSQHEVRGLIGGPTVYVCNECSKLVIDIWIEEGTFKDFMPEISKAIEFPPEYRQAGIPKLSYKNFRSEISKAIEFPPEYRQAGIAILSYFATILEQKFSNIEAKIRIDQEGSTVRMVVMTAEGNTEIIQKTLGEYASVIQGDLPVHVFLPNRLDALALENKLEMAQLEIRHTRELLRTSVTLRDERIISLEEQVKELRNLVGNGLNSVQSLVNVMETLSKNRSTEVEGAIKIIFTLVQRGLREDDKEIVEENLQIIAGKNPELLSRLIGLLGDMVSGAGGTLIASWITGITGSLPR